MYSQLVVIASQGTPEKVPEVNNHWSLCAESGKRQGMQERQ